MDGARLSAQHTNDAGASGGSDWLTCEHTRATLSRLDDVLDAAIETRDPELRIMALHLIRRGGKRLRPALVLLLGRLGPAPEAELLRVAAAIELLHVASLYHDDVMDRAPVRRGAPSVNGRWGNASAAVAGTYLFSCASRLLAVSGREVNRVGSEAVADLSAGQLLELENSYDPELSPEEHLAVLERKTAALFVLPCRLGAVLAGVPSEQADALREYGRKLGLAFQLADDALDLTGDAATVGKATGADMAEGVYSLAVLYAMREGGSSARRLEALLRRARPTAAELAEALAIVRDSGAIAQALAFARGLAGEARSAASALPAGDVRSSLERLAGHAVARTS